MTECAQTGRAERLSLIFLPGRAEARRALGFGLDRLLRPLGAAEECINVIEGSVLAKAVISGANNIANRKQSVDELNVFPVPDGDTGTNMSMTIGAG